MRHKRSVVRWGLTPLAILLFVALVVPAEARNRRGGGKRVIVVPRASSFYGYWGSPFYYSPYASAYYHHHAQRQERLNPALAKAMKIGALDLNVKPRSAEIYIDGTFVGNAHNFDGYPSYLWMDEGEHTVAIYKGGYQTFEETFDVRGGVIEDLKLRLAPGEAQPPAQLDESSEEGAGEPTGLPAVRR